MTTAFDKAVEFYVNRNWTRSAPEHVEGGWAVTIREMPGFVAFAEHHADLDEAYTAALRSMMRAYVRAGVAPPTPPAPTSFEPVGVPVMRASSTSYFALTGESGILLRLLR